MIAEHARYAEWDAAYVLGALEPAERREFESHLERCERCRAAVAELAAMPGLLSRLGPERAAGLLDEPGEADDADSPHATASPRPSLLDAVRLEGRRRTRRARARIAVVALVAAAVVLVAAALPAVLFDGDGGSRSVAFSTVAQLPVRASATLEPVAWGTRIELDCSYAEAPGVEPPEAGWTYGLFAVDRGGARSQLSTWRAAPGETARLEAGTALAGGDLASLEIRAMGTGEVLLRADVD